VVCPLGEGEHVPDPDLAEGGRAALGVARGGDRDKGPLTPGVSSQPPNAEQPAKHRFLPTENSPDKLFGARCFCVPLWLHPRQLSLTARTRKFEAYVVGLRVRTVVTPSANFARRAADEVGAFEFMATVQ
jgi:hypothetical protein